METIEVLPEEDIVTGLMLCVYFSCFCTTSGNPYALSSSCPLSDDDPALDNENRTLKK